MKWKIVHTSIIIVFVFTVQSVSAQETLVFSTFPADSPIVKICQAIMEAAYEKIGIDVVIQHYPPARGLQLANGGQTDGELYRSVRIDGKFSNLVMVPVAMTHTEIVVFTKDVEFPVEGWESLQPYRIGVERGFKLAEARTEGMNTQSANVEQTFQMLDAGRVDVVISTRRGGSGYVNKLHLKDINILTPPLETDMLHHFLHKKHQNLIPQLVETLENMKETGEIDAIIKQVEDMVLK